jgi:hypothetical protein
MNVKLQKKLEIILRKHRNDKNPPNYVKSIQNLLELENKNNRG